MGVGGPGAPTLASSGMVPVSSPSLGGFTFPSLPSSSPLTFGTLPVSPSGTPISGPSLPGTPSFSQPALGTPSLSPTIPLSLPSVGSIVAPTAAVNLLSIDAGIAAIPPSILPAELLPTVLAQINGLLAPLAPPSPTPPSIPAVLPPSVLASLSQGAFPTLPPPPPPGAPSFAGLPPTGLPSVTPLGSLPPPRPLPPSLLPSAPPSLSLAPTPIVPATPLSISLGTNNAGGGVQATAPNVNVNVPLPSSSLDAAVSQPVAANFGGGVNANLPVIATSVLTTPVSGLNLATVTPSQVLGVVTTTTAATLANGVIATVVGVVQVVAPGVHIERNIRNREVPTTFSTITTPAAEPSSSSSASPESDCSTRDGSTYTAEDTTFRIECNVADHGVRLDATYQDSVDECLDFCAATDQCTGISFFPMDDPAASGKGFCGLLDQSVEVGENTDSRLALEPQQGVWSAVADARLDMAMSLQANSKRGVGALIRRAFGFGKSWKLNWDILDD